MNKWPKDTDGKCKLLCEILSFVKKKLSLDNTVRINGKMVGDKIEIHIEKKGESDDRPDISADSTTS